MKQSYINHVVFVLDRSGSMASLIDETIKVFDSQIEYLATRSKELDQETRVSVYVFDGKVDCLVYDKDVLRLPSIKAEYFARGSTALIGASLKAIEDLEKTPELYGDHAFLVYVLTDGGNTDNGHLAPTLKTKIESLKENWTMAVLVPNQQGVFEAKKYGFPQNNIQVWATDNKGIREVGETIRQVTGAYMTGRAAGIRGTKSLFSLDATKLNTTAVKQNLVELKEDVDYKVLLVRNTVVKIKDFIESWKLNFRTGANYYELTKRETIQKDKQICVQDKLSGKVYTGLAGRQLLGLPDAEVKVDPVTHTKYTIYIQSNSNNRNLMPNTKLLVMV